MERIEITGSELEPYFLFDPQNNHFEISGTSNLINSEKYQKILFWLEEYAKQPNAQTKLVVKMDYFDIQTSRFFLEIFEKLEHIQKSGKKAEVLWCYKHNDEEMKEAGKEYASMVEVPFNEFCLN